MDTTRPLWLLDVDGPINLEHGKPGWGVKPRRSRVIGHDGRSFPLRWAPGLIVRIRNLHRSGAVEIKWATSWIGDTDLLAPVLGLPDFEPAYPDPGVPHTEVHIPLKQDAASQALTDGRRLIWTDDEAIPADWPDRPDFEGIALLIAPRPNRGLQPEHMDAIEAFTRQHTPEGAVP